MSNDKNDKLPAAPERAVQLHNNGLKAGGLIERALDNLTPDQRNNLWAKAADEALRLEVKKRDNDIDYDAGKKSLDSHTDAFNMLEKQGKLTRQKLQSDIKTGAGTMRIESKSGATCFVATATYDNADHPNVRFLRAFRDDCLLSSSGGRAFIDWYWRVGPRLALIVGNYTSLKWLARCVLSLIIVSIGLFWAAKPSGIAAKRDA